jgi:exonuclease I
MLCNTSIATNILWYQVIPHSKTLNHQQMHKETFIINCNTLLHVSTLLGHRQGVLSVIVTLRLHLQLSEMCC